jgi:protocatechuate 3,4-dioxygenase beta subunit
MKPFLPCLMLFLALPAWGRDCAPTPAAPMGTHYIPGAAQQKSDLGKGFVISGDVLSSRGCIRLNNARVEHWQADAHGVYVTSLRAYQSTGVDGRFRFGTEWPGLSPPHIHFLVTAPGHKPLITKWVGDRPLSAIYLKLVLVPEKLK